MASVQDLMAALLTYQQRHFLCYSLLEILDNVFEIAEYKCIMAYQLFID